MKKMDRKQRVGRRPYSRLINFLPKICGIGALIFLALAGILEGFRMSHDHQLAWLKENGTYTSATIINKGKVEGTSTTSKGNTSSNITYWVRYLPDGIPNEKENLVWESVHEIDFNRFEKGQRIHAWIAGERNYIEERSGFVGPDTGPFVIAGVLLLVCWVGSRKLRSRLKEY